MLFKTLHLYTTAEAGVALHIDDAASSCKNIKVICGDNAKIFSGSPFDIQMLRTRIMDKLSEIQDSLCAERPSHETWLSRYLSHPVFKTQIYVRPEADHADITLYSVGMDMSHLSKSVHHEWPDTLDLKVVAERATRIIKKMMLVQDAKTEVDNALNRFVPLLAGQARPLEGMPYSGLLMACLSRLNHLFKEDRSYERHVRALERIQGHLCDSSLSIQITAKELATHFKETFPAASLCHEFVSEIKKLTDDNEIDFYPIVSSCKREGLHSDAGLRYIKTGLKQAILNDVEGFEKQLFGEVVAMTLLDELFGVAFKHYYTSMLELSANEQDPEALSKSIEKMLLTLMLDNYLPKTGVN